MRILYVITGLGLGGAEKQVFDLARSIREAGNSILIVYLTGKIDDNFRDANIDVFATCDFKKKPVKGFFDLLKIIKTYAPDVVHSHMFHANIISRFSRIFVKIPLLISTAHSKNEGGLMRMLAYRITNRLADISTNVSKEAVEEFEKRKAVAVGQMIPVGNGIDLVKFNKNSLSRNKIRSEFSLADEPIFLAVGRLVEAKDYPNLLHAFSIVLGVNSNARLLLVGDGPLKNEIERIIAKLNLGDSIKLLGRRDDINDLMNASDFFVLSSAWEGFGLVVAEAMASEKIVIATNCGGVGEVMGGNGFLVRTNDSHALAQAMCDAMELSPEVAKKITSASRVRIEENYGIEGIAKKWMNIYQKVLEPIE